MNFSIEENGKNLAFCEFCHFLTILDYFEIIARTNFENPYGKNLDLHQKCDLS